MRRVDREGPKEDKKSANRRYIQIERNSQETQRTAPDSRQFSLTENQRLMIQHRLPKGYALLLVPKSTSSIKKNSNRLRNYSPTSTKNYEKEQTTPMRNAGPVARDSQSEEKKERNKRQLQSESSEVAEVVMVDDGTREHDSIDLVSDTPEVQPPKEIEQKPQKVEKPAQQAKKTIKIVPNQQKQQAKSAKNLPALLEKKPKQIEDQKKSNQVIQNTPAQQEQSIKPKEEVPLAKKFSEQFIILKQLKRHKGISLFLHPVNESRDGAPGYYKAIKQPMDLQTMQSKLQSGKYKEPIEFHLDLQRMLSNSRIYNKNNKGMIQLTNQIQQYYEKITKEVRKKGKTEKKTPVERANTRKSKKESLNQKKATKR